MQALSVRSILRHCKLLTITTSARCWCSRVPSSYLLVIITISSDNNFNNYNCDYDYGDLMMIIVIIATNTTSPPRGRGGGALLDLMKINAALGTRHGMG
jgi:hypothetical protein